MYINSIQQLDEDSIKFSLSTWTRRVIKSSYAKLLQELKKREKRENFSCRKFGHLTHNCRNSVKEEKEKLIPKNKFKVLVSQMMRCRIREEIKVQRQEKEKEKVKYFRYWRVEHYKWECPNIVVEKERRRKEKVVYMVRLQKIQ